jgi:6-pyruvoyltetrahydropterin/6-carboxytetrahydropterin synthase
MHKLNRSVRFSVNPFLPADEPGYNSFASRPAGEGLAVFLELGIELTGEINPATGLIVNVSDIDKVVQEGAVPVFSEGIRTEYKAQRHIGYNDLAQFLKIAWGNLEGGFDKLTADRLGSVKLSGLSLKLNPFRTLSITGQDCEMVYFSEKFEFAAAHKLWNEQFSENKNIKAFGRCANPAGHGHNYIVEVTIKWPVGQAIRTGDFEKVVYEKLIKQVDHKNLNEDIAEFGKITPTVENIAVFAWKKLVGGFDKAVLHCVTVWETDKTYSSYYGKTGGYGKGR